MSISASHIEELQKRLQEIAGVLDVDGLQKQVEALQSQMQAPDFWNDQAHARAISQQAADVEKDVVSVRDLETALTDAKDMLALAQEEGNADVQKDVEQQIAKAEKELRALELKTLLSGEYDTMNALLSIHAGAGGTDAMDWAEHLARMFLRYAEGRDWSVEVLEEARGEEAGMKRFTVAIRGRFAYGFLKNEAGVHRLVRISPFDAEGMRHTSFALVEVIPELDDVSEQAIEIPDGDLRIDTFASSGAGGQSVNTTNSAVRITHLPTNLVVSVQNERSQQQNKETAMRILKSRLQQQLIEQQKEHLEDLKGGHIKPEWGSQIRSYVQHPYKMVKDHRTNVETQDVDAVLNGDLEAFIEAELKRNAAV